MTVLIIKNGSDRSRGYVSLYMLQISVGVYIGKIDINIKENITRFLKDEISHKRDMYCTLITDKKNVQGFEFELLGKHVNGYKKEEFDSLFLITIDRV